MNEKLIFSKYNIYTNSMEAKYCIATYIKLHVCINKSMRKQSTGYDDFNERTNTLLYKNINLSHFILEMGDVSCVWEVSRDKDGLLFWPKFFLAHSSTSFSSWLGLLNCGSLRAQNPLSAAGSHFGILSLTDSNRSGTWLYYFLRPPASAVLPLIYTGASLDWRLGWGSIYNIKLYLPMQKKINELNVNFFLYELCN